MTEREGEIPQYKVVEPCFYAPHKLDPGSVIKTWGPPGPHLSPLNETARRMMDAWLEEEIDEIDERGQKTGEKIKHHAKYRFLSTQSDGAAPDAVEIVSGPPKEEPGNLDTSLAAASLRRPMGDMRPGPAPYAVQPTDFTGQVTIETMLQKPAKASAVPKEA